VRSFWHQLATPHTVPDRNADRAPTRSNVARRRGAQPSAPTGPPSVARPSAVAAAPTQKGAFRAVDICACTLDDVRRLADRGLYEEALAVLAADERHATVEGRLWKGILCLATERETEAVSAFRQCVFLEPAEVEYRRWLAAAYEAAGCHGEAERERRNVATMARS